MARDDIWATRPRTRRESRRRLRLLVVFLLWVMTGLEPGVERRI